MCFISVSILKLTLDLRLTKEKSKMASLKFVVALAVLTVVSSTKYKDKGKVNRPTRFIIEKSYLSIAKYASNYFLSLKMFTQPSCQCLH